MTLGPDHFNLTVSLGSVFVFQGDDEDDVLGGESEPYLWTFMVKVDGEGLIQDGNALVGAPVCFFGAGSHGNLGGSIEHGTRAVPPGVGTWSTSLQPIPISVAGQELTGLDRTLVAADAANGISAELPIDSWLSIPPGMTTHLVREAEGEWVHLACRTQVAAEGIGLSLGTISDARGVLGEVSQPLLVRSR